MVAQSRCCSLQIASLLKAATLTKLGLPGSVAGHSEHAGHLRVPTSLKPVHVKQRSSVWHSYAPETSCSQFQETCYATDIPLLVVSLCQVFF